MSVQWKCLVVIGMAAIIVVPFLTLHAAIEHLVYAESIALPPRDPGILVLGLFTLVALVPLALVGRALPLMARSARFVSHLTAKAERRCVQGFDVFVLPCDDLLIFTAGVHRPRTFISEGAIAALNSQEMAAALLHENSHIAAHDTRWRTALSALSRAYAFVPGVRGAIDALQKEAEIRADTRAVASGASRLALFDALVAVGTQGNAERLAVVRFSDGGLESRLRHIAGSEGEASAPAPWLLGWSVASLASIPVAAHALLAYEVICHSVMG